MTFKHNFQLQSAFRDFANVDHWHAPYAVTLTLKQAVRVETNVVSMWVRLTPERASQNFKHFMNVLNRKVFGKATRFGKRLRVIPVLEGGNGKRWHYHAVIDCPSDDLRNAFPGLIENVWLATQWGYDQTDIQSDADNGWITYISKFRDKPSYADAIDWTNCHID